MKRFFCAFIALLLLLCCSSCSQQPRPDITAFSQRLSSINERYAFDYFDMFIYQNVHHTYLTLCEENDVMLSFTLTENSNIENITVTVFSDCVNSENAKNEISQFFSACMDSFAVLTDKEKAEKDNKLSYTDTSYYFTDVYESYSALRYNFIFSSNPSYMCLYCEYYEPMSLN